MEIERGECREYARATNEMALTVRSCNENEAFARNCVCAFLSSLDPRISEMEDVKTAVSEAFTNCVVHAYGVGKKGEIHINVTLYDDSAKIVIRDDGKGIIDIEKAIQPFYTSMPDKDRSGLGFTIMETFMSGMKVNSDERGTTVTLYKVFDKQTETVEC